MASGVSGDRACIAAFKKLPQVAKDRLGEATDKTTFAILQRQRASVRVRSGALRAALDRSFSKTTGVGKVGIRQGAAAITVGGQRVAPGKYGHLVEFGHAKAGPHPFAIPAAEAEREPYLGRCREAGKAVERDMAAVGGAFL